MAWYPHTIGFALGPTAMCLCVYFINILINNRGAIGIMIIIACHSKITLIFCQWHVKATITNTQNFTACKLLDPEAYSIKSYWLIGRGIPIIWIRWRQYNGNPYTWNYYIETDPVRLHDLTGQTNDFTIFQKDAWPIEKNHPCNNVVRRFCVLDILPTTSPQRVRVDGWW